MGFNEAKNWVGLLCMLAWLSGCGSRTIPQKSNANYREDLSAVRPRYEYTEPVIEKKVEIKNEPAGKASQVPDGKSLHVNKRLSAVMDTVYRQNKAIRYVNGFRIQLYVGNVRHEADNAKSYIYTVFPDLNPYVSYSQPTYRVKAGDFMYRSDAEVYLEQIREQYASAVILTDRVEIKKSMMLTLPFEQN
jgi:hypothetical protein